ncbi:MAG: ATP-binding protein [Candidatus Methylacidiphilales bacterium]
MENISKRAGITLFTTVLLLGASLEIWGNPEIAAGTGHRIDWNNEELEFIRSTPAIRVGSEPDWPPFSYWDGDHGIRGIDHDLLIQLGKISGLRFEFVQGENWEEIEQKARDGYFDVLTGISRTEARGEQFLFTRPYASFPVAIITRAERPLLIDLRFNPNMRAVLPSGHVTLMHYRRDYPNRVVREVASSRDALLEVSRGRAEFTLENLVSASTLIRQEGLSNLKVAGITDYRFELHLAIRRDQPVLFSIIEKSIASLSDQEKDEILARWVRVEHHDFIVWQQFWVALLPVLLTMAVSLILITLGIIRLKQEIRQRFQAEKDLTLANEEKDRLLFTVVHDVNNPLTAISMLAESLQGTEDDQPRIQKIQALTQRLARMIRNLISIRDAGSSDSQIMNRTLELKEVMAGVVDLCSLRAQSKGIDIQMRLPDEPVLVSANPDALCQVLENLISNALKFSKAGDRIKVVLQALEQEAILFVIDEGPGILPEDQEKIWQPFTRLGNRPTAGEPSMGLGLYIVKQLVTQMGGTVKCSSTEGKGSSFSVHLSRIDPPVS